MLVASCRKPDDVTDLVDQAILSSVLSTAWIEHPGLAIQLTARFASPKLASDVRSLLLRFPERATEESDALQILIGPSLPTDVSVQIKVRLSDIKGANSAKCGSTFFTGLL